MTRTTDTFRTELLQYAIDRINDGCNRSVALMHAASMAMGAARLARLQQQANWQEFESIAQEFWGNCFPDDRDRYRQVQPEN
jgi:hypothetical protein